MGISWGDVGRVGAAFATGGLSEGYRALSGATQAGEVPGMAEDTEEARQARDRLLAEYDNAKPRQAPTVSSTTAGPAAQASGPDVRQAQQSQFGGVGNVTQAQAATSSSFKPVVAQASGVAPQVTAQGAGHQQIGPATTYGAAQIAPVARAQAGQASATQANAAQIDAAQQAEARQRSMALLSQIEGTAAGTGPTAADAMHRKAVDEAIGTQMGLASDARGTGRMTAQLGAAGNIAKLSATAGADAAIRKEQEIRAARDQLLRGYEGARGMDINLGATNAQMQQQTNLQNASLSTGVSQSNAANANAVNLANANAENVRGLNQAQLEQAAAAGNAAAQNEVKIRQAQMNQTSDLEYQRQRMEAEKANQAAALSNNQFNAQQGNQVSLANQAAAQQQGQFNATQEQQVNLTNAQAQNRLTELEAQLRSQNGMFNAQQYNEMIRLQQQLGSQTNMFNAGQTNQVNQFNAQQNQQAAIANLDAQMKQMGLDDTQRARLLEAYLREQELVQGYNTGAQKAQQDAANRRTELVGGVLGGGAAVGAKLASDRRTKKEILDLYSDDRGKKDKRALLDSYDGGGKDEIGEMLDHLQAVKFKYKDPKAEGAATGQRYGIIAQDLEKSDVGRSLVSEGDDGVKRIDTAQAVGVLLAAMAQMRQKAPKRRAA